MAEHRVRVHVDQAAAIRVGKNTWGDQVVVVNPADLTDAERQVMASLARTDEGQVLDLTGTHAATDIIRGGRVSIELQPIAEATADTVRVLLADLPRKIVAFHEAQVAEIQAMSDEEAARIANTNADPRVAERVRQARAAERERKIQDVLHARVGGYIYKDSHVAFYEHSLLDDPRVEARLAQEYAELERRHRAIDDRAAANREYDAAKRAAEEQREAEQSAFIARIIAEHGTRNQQERLAAGALPLGEATALAEQVIFAALDGEPRYEKLTRDDAEHSDECDDPDDCHVGYDAGEATEVPGHVWDMMQALRQKLGRDDAKIQARRHVATTSCEVETERWGVRIQIDEAGYEFAREYACATPQED